MQDSEKAEAFGIPWYTEVSFENWVEGWGTGAVGFVSGLIWSSELCFAKVILSKLDIFTGISSMCMYMVTCFSAGRID